MKKNKNKNPNIHFEITLNQILGKEIPKDANVLKQQYNIDKFEDLIKTLKN